MVSDRTLFQKHLGQTSQEPMMVEVERAEGIHIYSPDGKQYIDLIAGISVSALGHQHPEVTEAIHGQVDRHLHTMVYGEFVQAPQAQLAGAICETLPAKLNNIFMVNSGSEAVEGALKLAKRYTGRSEILYCKNAYHGSSHGALSVCGCEDLKNAFRPLLPATKAIRFGEISDLEMISDETAAVIIEPVQGEAGVRTATPEYFKALRSKCDQHGTLLIFDEIQTGFGRTGTFWYFEQLGIEPDILTCAKGMGGGMPLGAFISSQKIMHSLTHDPILGHISTFGGHPVSCAASLATVKYLQRSKVYEEAIRKGELFRSLLIHPLIKEIRNVGLLMAVRFESFELLLNIIHEALEEGLITDWFLFCNDSLRIAPPLTISEKEIKVACTKLINALNKV